MLTVNSLVNFEVTFEYVTKGNVYFRRTFNYDNWNSVVNRINCLYSDVSVALDATSQSLIDKFEIKIKPVIVQANVEPF